MKIRTQYLLLSGLLLLCTGPVRSQVAEEPDPCGRVSLYGGQNIALWGYYWSDYLADLARWEMHPFVQKAAIGQSVQNRPLYVLTVAKPGATENRHKVWIHARTHPIEAEGSYVTREIITELLSGSALADKLLDSCVFQILPMYNPDGVELKNSRENANGIDLESNWNAVLLQPEVSALKGFLTTAMQMENPIELALNMHSAYDCKRYFVYHAEKGTSLAFTRMEQRFISAVRSRFPGGIEPYTYFVSWTGGTPTQYAESWFWNNYQEKVLALTYEDMNCAEAGKFDITARALLGGAGEYLGVLTPVSGVEMLLDDSRDALARNYPNPFRQSTTIQFRLNESARVSITVWNSLGRQIATLHDGRLEQGTHEVRWNAAPEDAGIYYYRIQTGEKSLTRTMTVLK